MNSQRPKYQLVAEKIEKEVLAGKWEGGRMPSVRGIADLYAISIVTASRALQVLRDKGMIQSVERSGTFRLPSSTAERWAVMLRVTPGPYSTAVDGMLRNGFERLARREPMHLHFDAFRLRSPLTITDVESAAKTAIENGIHGVFMLPTRASDEDAQLESLFLEGCRNAGLPVILMERGLRKQEFCPTNDLVCLSDSLGATESTRHLIDLGRRRVALAIASPTTSHNERLAGYLYAIHTARVASGNKQEYPELVIRLPEETATSEVYRHLADRVVKEKIDGIICYHDYIAIGLIVELLARKIEVPTNVAVAGFDNMDIGSLFRPGLTTYTYPAEAMAEQAVRLMRQRLKNPAQAPVRVIVPGQLITRGSTVPL